MATTIVTKYGSDAPAASDIVRGELAVDTENGRLYTENAAGAVVEIGLKPEANVDVTGTITATGTSVFTNLDISGDIDVDGTTNLDVVDIDGAVDMASTLAVGGVVTANAGVVVDNFTLDGTTLALSSGNMTLDVAGDIILNADGGDVIFSDGATQIADFENYNSNFLISSSVQDKDLILGGNDGGSFVSALTLDMSEAGAATFNAGATFNGSVSVSPDTAGKNTFQLTTNASNDARLLMRSNTTTKVDIQANGPSYFNGGNVLVGGTSLDASGTIGFTSGGRIRQINASGVVDQSLLGAISGVSNGFQIDQDASNNQSYIFNIGAVPAVTIDGSANLLVGRTSVNNTGNGHSIRGADSAIFSRDASGETVQICRNASAGDIVRFYCNGVDKGSIDFDGSNTISYTTSSDQRLKENIADADDAGSKVDAIQVRKFDWKADGSHQDYGMIAQELIEVAPEAVSAPEDPEEMMGVDYSKLVPMLVKEIQQLRQRVAQLEE